MRTKSEVKAYEPFCKVQNMISAALGNLTKATDARHTVNEWLKEEIE